MMKNSINSFFRVVVVVSKLGSKPSSFLFSTICQPAFGKGERFSILLEYYQKRLLCQSSTCRGGGGGDE